jgi:hypothetical protein
VIDIDRYSVEIATETGVPNQQPLGPHRLEMDGDLQVPSESRDLAYGPRTERVVIHSLSLHEAREVLVESELEIRIAVRGAETGRIVWLFLTVSPVTIPSATRSKGRLHPLNQMPRHRIDER